MNNALQARPLTGWSGSPDYFKIREYDGYDPDAVLDVLHGRAAIVMFRGMVPRDVCDAVADRFWANTHRRVRGVEAPGFYLGAYSWNKPTAQYIAESEQVNPILRELLDVPGDPMKQFYTGLGAALAREGAVVRPAQHDGGSAAIALLRSWHGAGVFALDPHDDDSQCADPQMADFERRHVVDHQVAALNICLENDSEGGRLVYWNVKPDVESKRALGVEFTGSPYPLETLTGYESQWVEVRTGDVYVFNGAHVHAVEPNTAATQTRTTLAAMLGFVDDRTVVTWS
ncbi:hypothetical protein LO762_09010 [Actinocorallia sp. API 0066]|uniref:2OG-Fe(II)-dependent halogenase WelO5 family protein n=1 Tax=Actinocorallia sp. API 0066 TaxID=2896846 RepID=UPI001E642A9B|nr:hypothetical protein [Actinocorallia sp. API 0066]MCD0449326.1 hypothetical protein [Actinocorallia sp. API 0066]